MNKETLALELTKLWVSNCKEVPHEEVLYAYNSFLAGAKDPLGKLEAMDDEEEKIQEMVKNVKVTFSKMNNDGPHIWKPINKGDLR